MNWNTVELIKNENNSKQLIRLFVPKEETVVINHTKGENKV